MTISPGIGGQVVAFERLAGPGVDREDDRQLALEPADRREDPGEDLGVVDVGRPVQRQDAEGRDRSDRKSSRIGERRLSSRQASSVSIMTLPTRKIAVVRRPPPAAGSPRRSARSRTASG